MNEEIDAFPVTGWNIRTVPAYDIILLNLEFVASSMQSVDTPNPGRNYALTQAQVRELIVVLQRQLARLESAGPQAIPDTKQ